MPYTMFIYDEKDKSSVPELGDLFEVIEITHGVLDPSISGGRGTGVELKPVDMDNKERLTEMLREEIGFIFDNDESFLQNFALMECIDLVEVSFTDVPSLKFVYISSDGEHIADYISLNYYYEWKGKQ